ncbi:hypothetical protein [Cryobacterium roopkundense]|uniref:Uncharacterized protein n=1 Tax=Cryobacterium roopkundense TaxID=1001240 RepID=A0A7W9E4S4_9MICO|nr:hypothetical protein [Cryobacterium roopkundense]MBB5641215.1 hypothetical protein [Cryobacterium roopkundense]
MGDQFVATYLSAVSTIARVHLRRKPQRCRILQHSRPEGGQSSTAPAVTAPIVAVDVYSGELTTERVERVRRAHGLAKEHEAQAGERCHEQGRQQPPHDNP